LKPLSVTLPFAARFTDWGDSEPRAKAHQESSGSRKRDSGGEGERETLARFWIPLPTIGSVSDP